MKKNNALLVVGVVFVALLVGWLVTSDSQPKVGVKELKVAGIKAVDVTRVEVTVPPKPKKADESLKDSPQDSAKDDAKADVAVTVVLERDGQGFVVSSSTDAKKYPVDDAQMKPLLDAIAEFKAGDVVANKADKHKEFEIDDAQGTHVVIATAKGTQLDLLFGRAAKGGGTTVRELGKDDVFVAKGRVGTLVKKDASQWRKKAILDKKVEDFTAVTVTRDDGSKLAIVGETKEEAAPPPAEGDATPPPPPKKTTTWKLTEPALPAGFRLDESALGRIASSFATLRAADFADDVDDATAGFAAPHTIVSAKTTDGKDVVVHFGAKDEKKRVYVRVDGDPQVYFLADYAAKNVDKGLDDVRDMTLFTAKVDDVARVTFTAGKTRVVVKKTGAEWSLVEPKTAPAEFDVAQIASAVSGALRMRGSRLAAGIADAGGADPTVEVALQNGKTEVVRFGKGIVEEGAKAGDPAKELYIKGADGLVYVASSFTKTRYEKPTELFKKPPAPPPSMGGPGGMQGLDSLPPDVRKKLEASMRSKQLRQ